MTAADRADRVERYRLRLLEANSESARRELFKGLLQSLFGHDPGAAWVLDEMSLGAETVLKVPLPDRLKTGYADTQYGTVIIEYKQDLAKEGAAAEEQLAGYVLGNWHAGQAFRFTPIATDGAAWRVLTPRYEQLAAGPADPASLEMRVKDEFTLDGDADPEAFYLFLDRHLFGTEPVPPTLERIEREFGETGAVFITALTALRARFDACAADDELGPELAVAEEQWRRFLSIAYGTFDPGPDVFLVHTYLSVVAKLLAYEVLTGDDHIDDGELRGILTGEIFERLNVRGFTDKDFFAWVAEDAHLPRLRPAFREVAAAVGRFDFSNVSEDILKGVYQELIDLDTRHALGEYYTPDWLCERVLAEFEPAADARVLDPRVRQRVVPAGRRRPAAGVAPGPPAGRAGPAGGRHRHPPAERPDRQSDRADGPRPGGAEAQVADRVAGLPGEHAPHAGGQRRRTVRRQREDGGGRPGPHAAQGGHEQSGGVGRRRRRRRPARPHEPRQTRRGRRRRAGRPRRPRPPQDRPRAERRRRPTPSTASIGRSKPRSRTTATASGGSSSRTSSARRS